MTTRTQHSLTFSQTVEALNTPDARVMIPTEYAGAYMVSSDRNFHLRAVSHKAVVALHKRKMLVVRENLLAQRAWGRA